MTHKGTLASRRISMTVAGQLAVTYTYVPGVLTISADISGRHYNCDAEVVLLLERLRADLGGASKCSQYQKKQCADKKRGISSSGVLVDGGGRVRGRTDRG